MKLRALLVLTLASSLGGCFLWSSDKGPQPSPLPQFQQTGALREQWSHGLGNLEQSMLRPALNGGSVYAAGGTGIVARYDASGHEVWYVRTHARLSGGVGSNGSLVAVTSADGELLAFDAAQGKALWKVVTNGEVLTAPLVLDDMIVVRVGDNMLVAYNVVDGKQRWVYQRAQSPLALRNHAGLLLSGDLVVAGFPGGKLVAVTAKGGVQRWEASISQPKGSNELERMADIVGEPVARGTSICVAAFQGKVGCVDRDSGTVQWTRDLSSTVGLDADANAVYVTDTNDTVFALDPSNGATLWKQDKLLHRSLSRPTAVGNAVLVADAEGYLHTLNRKDGSFVARTRADSSGVAAPMAALPNNSVAVQARDGTLHAYAVTQ
jgi:outer membrane protein assembly factor BamB